MLPAAKWQFWLHCDSIGLTLYLFLVSCMLMYVQNSCYIPKTNPEFTNEFSINSVVQQKPIMLQEQSSLLACASLSWFHPSFSIPGDGRGTCCRVAHSTSKLQQQCNHEMTSAVSTQFLHYPLPLWKHQWSNYCTICLYRGVNNYKKITASITWNKLCIHMPVLKKNSYRITPCRAEKKKWGKVSFRSSLLTEAFWC